MIEAERLFTNARLCTMAGPGLGLVEAGAVAVSNGRIAYAGPASAFRGVADETIDLDGRLVTPGLIDCHTHVVHGGHRAREFALRLAGASYEEIARAGGGILSTVRATRALDAEALAQEALPRVDALIAEGVTTLEIKSGYGLSSDSEYAMLKAARRIGELRPVSVSPTLLAAHALPPEHAGDRAAYVDLIIGEMIPKVARERLADSVDGFCEGIAFSPEEIDRIFAAARKAGLPVRLHADQLSDLDGAALAARHAALSADHLEYTSPAGASAMAAAGTVAVMLPGAFYFLRESRKPPIEDFRRCGVAMAVATDCNPGSSPMTSLLLAMNMAATLFRMTVEECLLGVTRHAAAALGRLDSAGTLEVGKDADLAVWSVGDPAELVYRIGFNPLSLRIKGGRS